MKKIISIISISLLSLLLFSCGQVEPTDDIIEVPITDNDSLVVENQTKDLIELSKNILTAIKGENWSTFASYIHPIKGVRFSPYAHIDTNKQVILNMMDFATTISDKKLWGFYDGRGNEILLTTKEYFKEFVYNVDFLNAEQIKQDSLIGSGNSLNNLKDVYPNHHFVEFYFSGFNPEYEGMDWQTLRLVFEEYEKNYYLIGIIHDQWTI